MSDSTKHKSSVLHHEPSYGDIVWGQFKKSPLNMIALYLFLLLFLLAVISPLIASNQPFKVTYTDGNTLYPWFTGLLLNQNVYDKGVDLFFNILLVMSPLIMVASLIFKITMLKGVASRIRRKRTKRFVASLLCLILMMFLLLMLFQPQVALPNWKQLEVNGEVTAVFPPIHYSYDEVSFETNRPPELIMDCSTALDCPGEQICQSYRCVENVDPTCEADYQCASGLSCEEGLCEAPVCTVDLDCPSGYACNGGNCENYRQAHILGTDSSGRDVFVRMLFGTRISLTIGVIAVGIYIFIGSILGAIAGFFGGRIDIVIQRMIEVVMCFPSFILIMSFISLLPNRSIFWIMIFIGLTRWTTVARLVRGEFLKLKQSDFVQSAIASGLTTGRVIFRHIMPNAMGPVLVAATFGVANAILIEAGLSFLGLGDPSAPSWGVLLKDGRDYKNFSTMFLPGLAIFFTVSILNIMGEGLRDAMDPKLRR